MATPAPPTTTTTTTTTTASLPAIAAASATTASTTTAATTTSTATISSSTTTAVSTPPASAPATLNTAPPPTLTTDVPTPTATTAPLPPNPPPSTWPSPPVSSQPLPPPAPIPPSSLLKVGARRWSCEPCRYSKRRCDAVRPHCGRCVKIGHPHLCVFLGGGPGGRVVFKPAAAAGTAQRANLAAEERERRRVEQEKIDAAEPTWQVTPATLTTMLMQASLQSNLYRTCYDAELERGEAGRASTRLPPRPGADDAAAEEDDLADAYFRSRSVFIRVVHRASYLKDRVRVPAFLRAAICAMGATEATLRALPKQVFHHYYEFARSQTMQSSDTPSIENLQAVIILSEASFRVGKFAVGRLLSGIACRMVVLLKVDVDPDDLPGPFTAIEKETRRRCWFLTYLTERYISINDTRPSNLPVGATHVRPIRTDAEWESSSFDNFSSSTSSSIDADEDAGWHVHAFFDALDVNLYVLARGGGGAGDGAVGEAEGLSRVAGWRAVWGWRFDPDAAGRVPEAWRKASFCLDHGAGVFLAVRTLTRVLPRVVCGGEAVGVGDGVAVRRAFAAGMAAAGAIADEAARVRRGRRGEGGGEAGDGMPVWGVLQVFSAATFLAFAAAVLGSAEDGAGPVRARAAAAALVGPSEAVLGARRAEAARMFGEMVVMFRAERRWRPSYGEMCGQLREFERWAVFEDGDGEEEEDRWEAEEGVDVAAAERTTLVEEAAHNWKRTSEVSVEFIIVGILQLARSLLGSVPPSVVIDSNTDRASSQDVLEEQRALSSTGDGSFISLEPNPSGAERTAVADTNAGVNDSDWDKWEGFLNQLISGTEGDGEWSEGLLPLANALRSNPT
ncbi:hypothetical protein DFJ73DRAFT_792428 [Zopfochytrium polystomum]|nr:hypothetical protein DFJ73DRAFT_792428 [Zopfochytrium polystomum]